MIKELIVVEGKSDTVAVKRAVEADTIETGGSAVDRKVIAKIALAMERRGVIILTDPDHVEANASARLFPPRCQAASMHSSRRRMPHARGISVLRMHHRKRSVMRCSMYIPPLRGPLPLLGWRILWRRACWCIRERLSAGWRLATCLASGIVTANSYTSGWLCLASRGKNSPELSHKLIREALPHEWQ